MATPANPTSETLRIQRSVFDLDKREDVEVVKVVNFSPVTDAASALSRVGNDSDKFLAIINAGLRDFEREQALGDSANPWNTEDEEGTLTPFSGTLLSEEKTKQLSANVLNMAKMLFNYEKGMEPGLKKAAKQKAMEMILGNPAVIEALKK